MQAEYNEVCKKKKKPFKKRHQSYNENNKAKENLIK